MRPTLVGRFGLGDVALSFYTYFDRLLHLLVKPLTMYQLKMKI